MFTVRTDEVVVLVSLLLHRVVKYAQPCAVVAAVGLPRTSHRAGLLGRRHWGKEGRRG